VDTIECLLEAKIDLNWPNKFGTTALHISSKNGNEVICKSLMQAKAYIDCIDSVGDNPWKLAHRSGSQPIIELLTAAGAQGYVNSL